MVALKQSAKVALGGILCALSLVCMLLTFFPVSEIGLPALAGAVLIPIVLEIGVKWGWMAYACVGLLSLLICPNMESKLLFIAFFGYYPVLKAIVERLRKVWLEWLIKLVLFNATMVASYWLLLTFFGLPADSFEIFGVHLPLVILGLGNVTFVLYDIALTAVITTYMRSLHAKLMRLFRG